MVLESFRLDGRNALVTGSSRGLGAAIAIASGASRGECRMSRPERGRQSHQRTDPPDWGGSPFISRETWQVSSFMLL